MIKSGLTDVALFLIAAGADVNSSTSFWNSSPLHTAAKYNEPKVVQSLIDAGADMGWTDKPLDLRTPLTLAFDDGHVQVVKILVNACAEFKWDDSALVSAIQRGHVDMVPFLIDSGVNVNWSIVSHDMP